MEWALKVRWQKCLPANFGCLFHSRNDLSHPNTVKSMTSFRLRFYCTTIETMSILNAGQHCCRPRQWFNPSNSWTMNIEPRVIIIITQTVHSAWLWLLGLFLRTQLLRSHHLLRCSRLNLISVFHWHFQLFHVANTNLFHCFPLVFST